MRPSTLLWCHAPKEAIDENVKASFEKDRLLTIAQVSKNAQEDKENSKESKVKKRVHALSKIDDILFEQMLNDNLWL